MGKALYLSEQWVVESRGNGSVKKTIAVRASMTRRNLETTYRNVSDGKSAGLGEITIWEESPIRLRLWWPGMLCWGQPSLWDGA